MSTPPSPRARGGCLCGAVRYAVTGPLRNVINCHCRQCRRTHGHFAAYAACGREDLTLERDDGLAWYESSAKARRGFCRRCGSSLFWDAHGRNYVAVAAGTLDAPSGLTTEGHIYCADAGDYYTIDDDLPRWPGSMNPA